MAGAPMRAGLIDLDLTIITQALFFFALLAVLPRLIYRPLVARFDEREARTEGARGAAKDLRKQADAEVSLYEAAQAAQRRDALLERAETRVRAQRQADELVAQARAAAQARVDAGVAAQHAAAAEVSRGLAAEAESIGASIAAKLVRN